MNHESASYKSYKEELSDKTYVDYVMADGKANKLFSINYVNTIGYSEFIKEHREKIQLEISDLDSVTDVLKYIELSQMIQMISAYDINVNLRDLAIRHLQISMKVNTNVSEDDVRKVAETLTDMGILIETEAILDFDSKVLPISYGVRYMTIKHLENSLTKAGVDKQVIKQIKDKEYENRITTDMILLFRESGLKVPQFYGISYFSFKGLLFTYKFTYSVNITELQKFIDSFHYMQNAPAKYLLCMYNGDSQEDVVYKGITIAIRNVTECMDKFLLKGFSFTKSFKSQLGD